MGSNGGYKKLTKVRPRKMLVIEDDADILSALVAVFEMAGYVVQGTESGKWGEKLVEIFMPDVIVLDIFLTDGDGRVICRHIKSAAATCGIPVIAVSAFPGVGQLVLDAGADAFLAKPFDIGELVDVVGKKV